MVPQKEFILEFTLKFITNLDPIAVYAAVIATLVLFWDVFKWLSRGPKLKVDLLPNREIYGASFQKLEDKEFVIIKIYNRGETTTQITNISLTLYKSKWKKFTNKPLKCFVIPKPEITQEIPYKLNSGDEWTGRIEQNADLEEMAKNGILICEIRHSFSDKPIEKRIIVGRLNAKSNKISD